MRYSVLTNVLNVQSKRYPSECPAIAVSAMWCNGKSCIIYIQLTTHLDVWSHGGHAADCGYNYGVVYREGMWLHDLSVSTCR